MNVKVMGLTVVSLIVVSVSAQQAAVSPDTSKKKAPAVVQADSAKHQPSPGTVVKQSSLSGSVTSVDTLTKMLMVKDSKGVVHHFKFASDTKITKGAENTAITLKDIVINNNVTVTYTGEIVASVHVDVTKTPAVVPVPGTPKKENVPVKATPTDSSAVKTGTGK